MKKLLAVVASLCLSASAFAAVHAPAASDLNALPTIDFVGASACVVDAAVTTTGKACSTKPAIVYGFMTQLDTAGNYLVLWDSATGVASPSSFTVCASTGMNNTVSGGNSEVLYKFPVPVKVTNGLFAKPNATIAAGGMWTVIYRPLQATE